MYIVFSREAQWGSRGREFDSRHSDQTLLGRTFFGRVRPGSFFVFIDGFAGDIEVEDELDVIHKEIHRAAAVGLGALEGGNTELLQVGLYGGDTPHIGAVGIVDPDGNITVTQFEGHKEGVLCRQWCEALAKTAHCPAVVSAGVHYDQASREEILQIVRLCGELLQEAGSAL